MKKIHLRVFCILLLTMGGTSWAAEETGAVATGPVAMNCKKDIEKYCPEMEHGRGEIRSCLESHISEVSDSCKKALESTRGGRPGRSGRVDKVPRAPR